MNAGVITVSDSAYTGDREDKGGPAVAALLAEQGYTVVYTQVVPDEVGKIQKAICHCADSLHLPLIVTTGGTGMSPRDVTPEATEVVCQRMVPGIGEAMRSYGMQATPRAMLSRGICGIRGNSLILNLPGNPKAVKESLAPVLPTVTHGLATLLGTVKNCAEIKE